MISLLNGVLRIRPRDIPSIVKLFCTFVPAKIYKHLYKDVWIITEYPENARDNGYWLFKYVRENYPGKRVFYPIKRKASDYAKVAQLGNVIEFGGWKHYFLYWASHKFIGTTKYHGFPDERMCSGIFEMKLHRFKYVFLNHGFARGISNIINARNTDYDLIIAMSELEKKIMVELNGQPKEKVKAVGFCRHDNLDDSLLDKKTIVVMPTWRRWLDYRHEEDEQKVKEIKKRYKESPYYKKYMELLNHPRLLRYLEENDLKIIFYLHGYAQAYSGTFRSDSKRVVIARKNHYYVQDLLKQAAFLVTDYSSVFFDFAYMKKPMVYFQFDIEEFSKNQYAESEYYQYSRDGFGPITDTVDEVVNAIENAHRNNFQMDPKYIERVELFFKEFGKNHCQKIYKLIDEL